MNLETFALPQGRKSLAVRRSEEVSAPSSRASTSEGQEKLSLARLQVRRHAMVATAFQKSADDGAQLVNQLVTRLS